MNQFNSALLSCGVLFLLRLTFFESSGAILFVLRLCRSAARGLGTAVAARMRKGIEGVTEHLN